MRGGSAVLLMAVMLFFGGCSVEVPFDYTLDIQLDRDSGEQRKVVVVTEAAISGSLDKSGYALSEFDDLVLNGASVTVLEAQGWYSILSMEIAFSNDFVGNRVLSLGQDASGSGLTRPLYFEDGVLLKLFQGKSFFVDLAATLEDDAAPLIRIHLTGQLSKNLP